MKKKGLLLFGITCLALMVASLPFMAACAKPAPAPPPAPAPVPAPAPAPPATPTLPKSVTLATWEMGSRSYDRSVAIATIIEKYTGMKAIVQPMAGLQWAEQLRAGNVDFGGANSMDTLHAYMGTGPFEGMGPNTELRVFHCAGVTPSTTFARADRDIKTLADLRGKKLYGERPPAPIIGTFVKYMLEYYGIGENEITILPYSKSTEAVSGIIEGRGDAYIDSIAAHVNEARQGTELIFLPTPKEVVDYANSKQGADVFVPSQATATMEKTYGIPQGLPIWGWAQVNCVDKDLGEETVYAMVKALYENYDELAAMGPVAAKITLEVALKTPILPFHPGVIKYYKEKGIWTAELEATQQRLLAEEAKLKK